jgi:hypothetical protein
MLTKVLKEFRVEIASFFVSISASVTRLGELLPFGQSFTLGIF